MNKLFKLFSLLLLATQTSTNATPKEVDHIKLKYQENYVQLSNTEEISVIDDFVEVESTYPNMGYRDYTYNLFKDAPNYEDATPYMLPFAKYALENDNGLYGLEYKTAENQTRYANFYYNNFYENFHFYKNETNTIEFYLDISSFYRTSLTIDNPLETMLNYYTEQAVDDIVFEIPLIIIDGVDTAGFLLNAVEGEEHIYFYSRVGNVKYVQKTTSNTKRFLNIKIPRVDTINQIDILNMKVFNDLSTFNNFTLNESDLNTLVFHEDLKNLHAPFLFEVADINLLDKTVSFDHFTGTGFNDSLYIENETVNGFVAESIKLKFNTTQNTVIGSSISSQKYVIPKTLDLRFKSEENGVYTYDIITELPELQTSGSVEVLEVTYEVKTDTQLSSQDYKHIYEDIIEHPTFAYTSATAIRTYYYDLTQYGLQAANIFSNWDEIFTGIGHLLTVGISAIPAFKGFFYKLNLANAIINNYYMVQAYGFNFYFDDAKTKPIENIQSVKTKYQYGSNYSTDFNTNKAYLATYPIKIKTMTSTDFTNTNLLGNYKIDKEKGIIMFDYTSNKIPEDMRGYNAYNGNAYDYVIMNCYKIGDMSTCIRHMESLEIQYVAKGYETVKLVSNSLGLHIVDGKVYGADGMYYPEYGVYESDDGTQVVGKDTNNDGKITADETINSDTGVFDGEELPEEDKWSEKWEQFIENLTKENGYLDKFKVILIIALGMAGVYLIIRYVVPFFKTIGTATKAVKKQTTKKKKRKENNK